MQNLEEEYAIMATAKDEHSLPSDHPDALESSGDHFLSPGAEDGPVVVQFGDSARPSSEALGIVAHTPSSSGSRPAHTPAGHMGSSSEESQYISTLEPSPQEEKKVSFTGAAAHAEASSTRGSDESKLLTKQSENGHILNTHQHKATLVQMSTEEQDSGTLHVESTRAMPTGPRLGHPEVGCDTHDQIECKCHSEVTGGFMYCGGSIVVRYRARMGNVPSPT